MLNITSLIHLVTGNFIYCPCERRLKIQPLFISHGSLPSYASSVCPENSGENDIIRINYVFIEKRHLIDIGVKLFDSCKVFHSIMVIESINLSFINRDVYLFVGVLAKIFE